ncbi:MAG: hypothetical protein GTO41_23785 [Burkholderiales bacterium]|nr:hypothetical protein [Burkholderiales bacterium]
MSTTNRFGIVAIPVIALLLFATTALAQTDASRVDELEAKMIALAAELASLRDELEKQAGSTADLDAIRSDIDAAQQAAAKATQSAAEWNDVTSVTHLSGYASADYFSVDNGPSAFVANFNPMFHFLYDDKVLWEAELEVQVSENGDTEIGLEYTTVDIFLTDNLTLLAGKFLSPIGNFRQNLHPSWINKLPTAPPGFGHDGAAPISEIGMQLRGVAPVGDNSRITYSAYVGNGPKLEGEDGEIHAIEAEGFASDPDDEFVFGGRVAFLPTPQLELAVSGAFGDVAVVENDGVDVDDDPTRDYTVFGFDVTYRWDNFDFRGEYVSQEVDEQELSVAAEGGKWETWYAQGAYKFGQGKWEGVVRYTDFTSPHADDSQEQWAFGVNYLIAPSAMVKFGYESNKGEPGEITDDDRWVAQIAYGY